MADATVTFELREIDAVKRLLANAALDSGDRGQLLQSIGYAMEAQTRGRFDTKRSPEGDSWQALAQRTQDYYAEEGLGHRSLLVGSGMLHGSVTHEVEGGA